MLTRRSRVVVASALAWATLSFSVTTAHAGPPVDREVKYGGGQGSNLYAGAMKIAWDKSKNGTGRSTGALTARNWSPPPCWYAPLWTPRQFEKKVEGGYERVVKDGEQPSYAKQAVSMDRDYYKDGEYKNYNKKKQGKGKWWGVVENPNEEDSAKRSSCTERAFWVDEGDAPEVEGSIDPEMLAALAYEQIQVPGTSVEMNPAGKQTVNLNTWTWLDSSQFKPVSVTAALNELNISATTTATPVSLKIEPGTKDADLFPASGECEIGKDGRIGKPYTKGQADKSPPCGLTYLRATTGSGTYNLKATITWEIEWTGSGDTGGDLPDGTFGNDQPVTVQEAQAVVR